jgi:D-tyrosyl-tRNA(Tyr) deacylase
VKDGQVRAVVSRVSTAAVTVEGKVVGEIGTGLLALVGVGREDDGTTARALARKIHELRIFPGEDGARSASDLGLPVLVVSQFTLYADTRKGRRPSWQDAATGKSRSRWSTRWSRNCGAAGARSPRGSSAPGCRSAR